MRRSLGWVALAALVALCSVPSGLSPFQYGGAVAADSLVPDAASSSSLLADTAALDEMLLDAKGRRQRWTSVPNLVVLTSVMEYHDGDSIEYVGTSELLNEEDRMDLVADLTVALRQLSNHTFEQFASIQFETVAPGAAVAIVRPKQIVVGRYRGLRRLAKTIGLGGRTARRDGAIVGAAILLDSEFDRSSDERRLLRTHELGHTLGFNHVKSRISIMNPHIGPELTAIDRQIVMQAFQRDRLRPIVE